MANRYMTDSQFEKWMKSLEQGGEGGFEKYTDNQYFYSDAPSGHIEFWEELYDAEGETMYWDLRVEFKTDQNELWEIIKTACAMKQADTLLGQKRYQYEKVNKDIKELKKLLHIKKEEAGKILLERDAIIRNEQKLKSEKAQGKETRNT